MSKCIVEATSSPNIYQFAETDNVELRIYANAPFITYHGQPIPAGSPNGPNDWYLPVPCEIQGGDIFYISSFEIDTTEDSATDRSATYTAWLFANGERVGTVPFLAGFGIPASVDHSLGLDESATWVSLTLHRDSRNPPPREGVYDIGQVEYLVSLGIALLRRSSSTIIGNTALTVDPVDPQFPIAIGENDPRVALLVLASDTDIGATRLSAAPVSALDPIAAGDNDLRVNRRILVIDVAGIGAISPASASFKAGIVKLTGVLTGDRTVNWPTDNLSELTFWNATTGEFNLFVKTPTEATGVRVNSGQQAILVNDGTNVYNITPSPDYASVLEFPLENAIDGSAHINHGKFWPTTTSLGPCYWEAIVMPRDSGSRYIVSDGYGGAHAVLFGFNSLGAGTLNKIYFSSYDGTVLMNNVVVNSEDGLMPNEWGHVAAAYDGTYLYVYVNGVLSGKKAFGAGARHSLPYLGSGGGHLYIGGSNHNMFNGRLAMVRGWEGANPLVSVHSSFLPETIFTTAAFSASGVWVPASFLADYTRAGGKIITDLSPSGYNGSHHPGTLWNSVGGIAFGFGGQGTPFSSYPLPLWVQDTSCPLFSPIIAPSAPAGFTNVAPATPGGAIIFDSFSRANRTWFLGSPGPGLGSTEAGSAGVQAWATTHFGADGDAFFGILNGIACFLGNERGGIAFVESGTAAVDVRVSGRRGNFGSRATGLVFRYQDRSNFWFAEVYNPANDLAITKVRIGKVIAGALTSLYDAVEAASFTTLRATANGTTITLYIDDGGAGWTQLHQALAQTDLQTQTKVGLLNFVQSSQASGLARFDNFMVLAS